MKTAESSIALFVFLVTALVWISCSKANPFKNKKNTDKDVINLDQNVTINSKPKDSIFINFEKNWVQFVSKDERLLKPVVVEAGKTEWNPMISSNCVFSEAAGAYVPRVTIAWTERQTSHSEASERFDLSLQYKGFERNLFTTIWPIQSNQRFKLPGNSTYIQDTTALMLTGPSLFPKLVQFNVTSVDMQNNPADKGGMNRYSLVMDDFGGGLSYTLRRCLYQGDHWTQEHQLIFTTPVCPQNF